MATAEEKAVELIGAVQDIINEGGDPIEALARIVTTVSEGHSLLCLTIKANHDDQSVGATVTFDNRYLTPPLLDMAYDVLNSFIRDTLKEQGEVDAATKH